MLGLVGLVVLLLAIGAWRRYWKSPSDAGSLSTDAEWKGNPNTSQFPLRIVSFNVEHLGRTEDGKNVASRGVFGKDTYGAKQKDYVKLRLTLSRPGFAYLIAFRPDGAIELCYPNDDFTQPPLSETAAYPFLPEDRNNGYGLSEAPGLWTFVAVVSDIELPTFDKWRKQHPLPEMKGAVGVVGVVLVDDGTEIDQFTTLGLKRGTRGKGEAIPGQADIEKVGNALNHASPRPLFRVVGIMATAAK